MVDTLEWKNLSIKGGVRNVMEDSTDTLVDDGHKVRHKSEFFFSAISFDIDVLSITFMI